MAHLALVSLERSQDAMPLLNLPALLNSSARNGLSGGYAYQLKITKKEDSNVEIGGLTAGRPFGIGGGDGRRRREG